MKKYFKTSNLIEGVDDKKEDEKAVRSFNILIDLELFSEHFKMICYHTEIGHLNDYCTPGKLRTYSVKVGDRVCIDHTKISNALEKLFKKEPKNWKEVKSWHIELMKIHPFGDGNGRVGRMLMAVQCHKLGLLDKLKKEFEGDFDEMRINYYNWFK